MAEASHHVSLTP